MSSKEKKSGFEGLFEYWATLGLDNGPVECLKDEDWVFVLKMAFYMEISIKRCAAAVLNAKEAQEQISAIEVNKLVKLLVALNEFSKTDSLIAEFFASTRNALIHNIEGHRFTFKEKLTESQFRGDFIGAFRNIYIGDEKLITKEALIEHISNNPKSVWLDGLMYVLNNCGLIDMTHSMTKELQESKIKIGELASRILELQSED